MTQPEQTRSSKPRQAEPEQVIIKKEPEEEVQVRSEPVQDAITQNLECIQYTRPKTKLHVHCAKVKEKSRGEEMTSVGDSFVTGESK